MIQKIVTQLVREICRKTVRPDEPLLSSGLLDSVSIVDLLLGLEQRFQVQLGIEDLDADRLDTVDCIVILIKEKLTVEQLNSVK